MSAARLSVPQLRLLARLGQGWEVHRRVVPGGGYWEAVSPGGVRERLYSPTVQRLLQGTNDRGPLVAVTCGVRLDALRLVLTVAGGRAIGLHQPWEDRPVGGETGGRGAVNELEWVM